MNRKNTKLLVSCLATSSIFATTTVLAEATKLEAVQVVTTVSKVSQNIKNVTSNVNIISAEDIEQRGFKTLSDALKTVSGINFSRYGGLGTKTNINIRGMSDSNLLILLNGVRLNDPASPFSSAHLSGISLENIERIEVLKGAQSGIWGADAVAGVINIITKTATKNGFNTNLNLEYGSFNTSTIGLASTFKQDEFDAAIALSQQKTDGYSSSTTAGKKATEFEDDEYENISVALNAGYDINQNNRVEAFFNQSETDASYDGTLSKDENGVSLPKGNPKRGLYKANNKGSFKGDSPRTYGANYQNTTGNLFTKLSVSRAEVTSYFKNTDLQSKVRNFDYEGITDEINLISSLNYNKEDFFVIGVDYRAEEYHRKEERTGKPIVLLDKKRNNTGIFLTNSNVFNSVDKDTTIFNQSLRYDDSNIYGGHTTYKLGAKHNFNNYNDLWVSANYATAFKAPSSHQLYAGTRNNPDLKPETTKSLDFTVHFNNLEVTYFKNQVTDLIKIEERNGERKRYNLDGESNFEGVEVNYTTELAIIDSDLSFNYTYTDARDGDEERLLRIPYHQANIMLDYYGVDNLTMGAKIATMGKTLQKNYYLASSNPNHETNIPLNTTIDLTADYQVNNQLNVYGRIDNVLDNDKPSILNYGVAERSYYVGIRYNFN